MAPKSPPLAAWPWQWFGDYKYLLCLPLGLMACQEYMNTPGESILSNTFFHILLLSVLRCVVYCAWHFVSRSTFWFRARRIQSEQVCFEQVDREADWDNYVILQALIGGICCQIWNPRILSGLPGYSLKGLPLLLALHAGPAELLYYCIHRAFHQIKYLYEGYHSFHHLSTRLEPSTAGTATFLEHLLLTLVMSIPLVGIIAGNAASWSLVYAYILAFDFVRFMIHSNVEVVPFWLFQHIPVSRYLVVTPSYHTLHHKHESGNYCLFLPLYDYLGGTLDPSSFKLHEDMATIGKEMVVPDTVFVAHAVDLVSILHMGFTGRTFCTYPRGSGVNWFAQLWTPILFCIVWVPLYFGRVFTVAQFSLLGLNQQSWGVPVAGFQYFVPNTHRLINKILERAILDADKMGVKVITLAALNKNEAMNGGGQIFVEKHKNLKVRVCHGNTLTAAVILHELAENVKEVFLTGSTSKIGRALALYLCRKRVRVMMLTASEERFVSVANEAPEDCRQYLIRVTGYQAGKNCKTWIIGKWASESAQTLAPAGTSFHQFAMPSIPHFRKDCRYYDSAGMRLPEKLVQGVNCCENTMPRYVVHACNAGGLVHTLEGWQHHEVGPVDVDQLDVVWEAAMRHGFTPA